VPPLGLIAGRGPGLRLPLPLLPLLLLPITLPLVIGAVNSTAAIFTEPPGEFLGFWVKFLVVFNIIFVTLPLLLFDYVLEE